MPASPFRAAAAAAVLALGLAVPAAARQTEQPPPADPADVASLDAILTALYDVISGPAGEARDWDRFRSLFVPGARLMPVSRQQGGSPRAIVWTPDEYVQRAGANLEQNGFFEREIGRITETYGGVTHAFSAYESRRTAEGEIIARGINSIQLLNDGNRWWVVSIYWQGETPDNPIPARYIGGR